MKARFAALALAIPLALFATSAQADDAVSTHSIEAVLAQPANSSQLEGVQLSFGDAPHGPVARRIEPDVTTSLRTRKLGRSSEEACQWVLMSALIQMREHALAVGGNAVVNIRSNWRNVEWSSSTEYQCAAGFLMAGVALKGDVVSLR